MNEINTNQNLDKEDLDELLKLKKKQLRIDVTILVLIVLIIILLLFILFRKCTCNCNCCELNESCTTQIVPDNIIETESNEKVDEREGTERIKADEIKLSERDTSHRENQPFDVLFAPGDSETKKYAVEVTHKDKIDLFFSLDDIEIYDANSEQVDISEILDEDDSVLDIIDLKVVVDGNKMYDDTLKEFVNNKLTYTLNTIDSSDIVEYSITNSISPSISDNYSNNSDGNYQNMLVNFSLKWWIE